MNSANKDAVYHKRWAEAIYSIYLSSKAAWGVSEHSQMAISRSYALGEQDVDKYKKFLLDEEQGDQDSSLSIDDMPIARVAKREG